MFRRAFPGSFEDRPTGLSGADISRTSAGTNTTTNEPILLFELNRGAAGRFAVITQRLFETLTTTSADQLAFVLDGETLVAAVVQWPDPGRQWADQRPLHG